PRRALDRARALEVHARAALVGLVGGIEGDGDAVDGRALAHGERLAAALVAQARSHEIEALLVRLAEVREAGLVTDDVDPRVGDGLAVRVLHVAELAEAAVDLMLGRGRRGESRMIRTREPWSGVAGS